MISCMLSQNTFRKVEKRSGSLAIGMLSFSSGRLMIEIFSFLASSITDTERCQIAGSSFQYQLI